MNFVGRSGLGLGLGLAMAGGALAETSSEMLYSYKHWEVEYVTFDDGSVACLAEVDATSDSFTIWTYPDGSVSLQFYSTSWDFGDTGDTANLQVIVDSRAPWNLTNADLYLNSVNFGLPDSDAGADFLGEVARGMRLYLNSENGEPVMDYSLQGSRASMGKLGECTDYIMSGGSDANPFN